MTYGSITRSLLVASIAVAGAFAQNQKGQYLAPWVTSPMAVVERMLELAQVKPGETVFDLGSGDGRVLKVAASKFGAKAVGIELSENLVRRSLESIKREGLEDKISVIHGNLMDADVSKADVVTIYLLSDSNDVVRPKLESSLKPGARVVSHDFAIRGWEPTQVDRSDANRRDHAIYVYTVPQSFKKK
jgi:protein-L-isoaspartate O-methyltransferase